MHFLNWDSFFIDISRFVLSWQNQKPKPKTSRTGNHLLSKPLAQMVKCPPCQQQLMCAVSWPTIGSGEGRRATCNMGLRQAERQCGRKGLALFHLPGFQSCFCCWVALRNGRPELFSWFLGGKSQEATCRSQCGSHSSLHQGCGTKFPTWVAQTTRVYPLEALETRSRRSRSQQLVPWRTRREDSASTFPQLPTVYCNLFVEASSQLQPTSSWGGDSPCVQIVPFLQC